MSHQLKKLILASAFFLDNNYLLLYFESQHLVLFLPEGLIAVYFKSIASRTRTYNLSNESDALFYLTPFNFPLSGENIKVPRLVFLAQAPLIF